LIHDWIGAAKLCLCEAGRANQNRLVPLALKSVSQFLEVGSLTISRSNAMVEWDLHR
jgi:hypothetical protein